MDVVLLASTQHDGSGQDAPAPATTTSLGESCRPDSMAHVFGSHSPGLLILFSFFLFFFCSRLLRIFPLE